MIRVRGSHQSSLAVIVFTLAFVAAGALAPALHGQAAKLDPLVYTVRFQAVDYYVKGPVVGLILDAHIRHATNGRKSMDDVTRLKYQLW